VNTGSCTGDGWFISRNWFVWLIETHQMNNTNQMNQINSFPSIVRLSCGLGFFLSTSV